MPNSTANCPGTSSGKLRLVAHLSISNCLTVGDLLKGSPYCFSEFRSPKQQGWDKVRVSSAEVEIQPANSILKNRQIILNRKILDCGAEMLLVIKP